MGDQDIGRAIPPTVLLREGDLRPVRTPAGAGSARQLKRDASAPSLAAAHESRRPPLEVVSCLSALEESGVSVRSVGPALAGIRQGRPRPHLPSSRASLYRRFTAGLTVAFDATWRGARVQTVPVTGLEPVSVASDGHSLDVTSDLDFWGLIAESCALRHPHLVTLVGVSVDAGGTPRHVVLQPTGLSAAAHLRCRGSGFALQEVVDTVSDACAALKQLHTGGPAPCVHGRVSAHNVVLGPRHALLDGITPLLAPWFDAGGGPLAPPSWSRHVLSLVPQLHRAASIAGRHGNRPQGRGGDGSSPLPSPRRGAKGGTTDLVSLLDSAVGPVMAAGVAMLPPEMLDDTLTAPGEDVEPTTPADVYAVGALCVELTLGAPPAPANVAQGRAEAIARHPELAQVLQGCLAEGITERLRLDNVVRLLDKAKQAERYREEAVSGGEEIKLARALCLMSARVHTAYAARDALQQDLAAAQSHLEEQHAASRFVEGRLEEVSGRLDQVVRARTQAEREIREAHEGLVRERESASALERKHEEATKRVKEEKGRRLAAESRLKDLESKLQSLTKDREKMEDCVEEVAKLVREEESILQDLRRRKADADGIFTSSRGAASALRQQLEEASRMVTAGHVGSAAASTPATAAPSGRSSLAAVGTSASAGDKAAAPSVVSLGSGSGTGSGLPTVKGNHATPRTLASEGMRSAPQTSRAGEPHAIGLGPASAVATTAATATAAATADAADVSTSSMPSSSTAPASNPSGSVSPGTRCDFCGRLGHRVGVGLLGRGRVRPLFTCPLLVEQTWSAADVRGVLNEDNKLPSEWARWIEVNLIRNCDHRQMLAVLAEQGFRPPNLKERIPAAASTRASGTHSASPAVASGPAPGPSARTIQIGINGQSTSGAARGGSVGARPNTSGSRSGPASSRSTGRRGSVQVSTRERRPAKRVG